MKLLHTIIGLCLTTSAFAGNSYYGSFFGNGSGLTNVSARGSFLVQSPGSYTDHATIFTNLQEAFNVISNNAMSLTLITNNNGWRVTQPWASYSVEIDKDTTCYSPNGFYLNVNSSCTVDLFGHVGSRIIGDSNVLTCIGISGGIEGNECLKLNVHGLTFLCLNASAKTMMVYLYASTCRFYDNIMAPYYIFSRPQSLPIIGQTYVPTNDPAIIGLMGWGLHDRYEVDGNLTAGLGISVVAPHEHWSIHDNEFADNYGVNNVTNLWNSSDYYQVNPPQFPLQSGVWGWELGIGMSIYVAGSGDTMIYNNVIPTGVYMAGSPALGPIAVFYNSCEGSVASVRGLMVPQSYVTNPFCDYYGNTSPHNRGLVNVIPAFDILSLTNIYLSNFIDPAGAVDPTLNSHFVLQSASTTLNHSTDFNTAQGVWTNAGNTDARLFLNPADGDVSSGQFYTSNSASGKYGFNFAVLPQVVEGHTILPIPPSDVNYGAVLDNAGGSAAPGTWALGTNLNVSLKPSLILTNFLVFDGWTRIWSNGVPFQLTASNTWNVR